MGRRDQKGRASSETPVPQDVDTMALSLSLSLFWKLMI